MSIFYAWIKSIVKTVLPIRVCRWISAKQSLIQRPIVGSVRFGNLRQLKPTSCVFGLDRGQPIDRYYIERFLSAQSPNIQKHVLEIGDDIYTLKFGSDNVTKSEVFHAAAGNPKATIIGDLTRAENIPSDIFDCIICTQTIHVIYNFKEVISTLHRVLKPGGVLLATFPGISQISRYDMDRWGDYWRFTTLSAKRLFGDVFQSENVEVCAYGNVLVAVAFLHGLAAEELKKEELDYHDPDYEVLITVRAVKPEK